MLHMIHGSACAGWTEYYRISVLYQLREAAKQVFFLVAWPLRGVGEGLSCWATKKELFLRLPLSYHETCAFADAVQICGDI